MPLETLVLPPVTNNSEIALPPPAPLTVGEVLFAIAADAASAAGDYLRDTEVPHGGE